MVNANNFYFAGRKRVAASSNTVAEAIDGLRLTCGKAKRECFLMRDRSSGLSILFPCWRNCSGSAISGGTGPLRRRWSLIYLHLGSLPLFALLISSVQGHEGHGGAEIGPYDLDTPRQVTPETAAHIGLQTTEVDFGIVEDVLHLFGIVRPAPDRYWVISPRTAGKITNVHVQVGDRVREGDVLVEIDSPELARNVYEARKLEAEYQKLLVELARGEGRVEQLRVEVENAEQTAVLSEAELQRMESAGESVIPLNILAERRAATIRVRGDAKLRIVDLRVASEELNALQHQAEALMLSRDALLAVSNVEPARSGPGDAEVQGKSELPINVVRLRAPADGVVIERSARPGHWVQPGERVLAIADFSVIQVEGELPESLIARLADRKSDVVRVRTPADSRFMGIGRVQYISPVLDEVKRTAHVLVEAPNPDGVLRGGTFVDLSVVLREEKTAVVVPVSAVLQDGPVHFVFVKQKDDVYQKQDIAPGLTNDQVVEVLSGLAPGDVVVSQGVYSLTQLRPKTAAVVSATLPGAATTQK